MTWIADGMTLYFSPESQATPGSQDFVGLHNQSLARVIAQRHNADLAEMEQWRQNNRQALRLLAAADATAAQARQRIAYLEAQLAQARAREAEAAALLCGVRHYARRHGLPIGECVAWIVLKQLHSVGASDADDDRRWAAYQQQGGTAYAQYGQRAKEAPDGL